ncbi:MAG: hypothetical protein MHMPM18_000010 [Marteilia pararefringens]
MSKVFLLATSLTLLDQSILKLIYKEPLLQIDTSFYPKSSKIVVNNGFALNYNFYTRTPLWTYEVIMPHIDRKKKKIKRPRMFFTDESIPQQFQLKHNDYTKSGYSRGHMVPAYNLKYDPETYDETFKLSNIVPQLQSNNAGVWLDIEDKVRDFATSGKFDEIHVWTGPIFHYQDGDIIRKIKNKITIPTHLYKVIYLVRRDKKISFAVIIANNSDNIVYPVSFELLEYLTGLQFPDIIKKDSLKQKHVLCIGSKPNMWHIKD